MPRLISIGWRASALAGEGVSPSADGSSRWVHNSNPKETVKNPKPLGLGVRQQVCVSFADAYP